MHTAMNILMFGWEFPPNHSGGLGTACHGIARGCRAIDGVELTIVLPKLFGGEDRDCANFIELPDGAVLWPAENSSSGKPPNPYGNDLVRTAQRYAEQAGALALSHPGFDVIHAHDWLTANAGVAAKRATNKPLVLHIHSTEYDRSGAHADPRIAAIESNAMAAADLIIAVSEYTRRIVIERYGQSRHKVRTVYNGITASVLPFKTKRSSTHKTVTFLGRVTHQKGPAFFIAAAARALALFPDLYFVMAGDGDLLPEMKRQAVSLGLGDRIAFPGFLASDEVVHLMSHSDIYVMPSVSEPFGIAALEAINAGVPVIICKQSGVAELFDHVLKVDYWDVATLAAEIVRLARDVGLAERQRDAALLELEGLDWIACAKALRRNYQHLLKSYISS